MKAFGFTIVLTSFLIASSMSGNALSIPQADVMAANDTIRVKKDSVNMNDTVPYYNETLEDFVITTTRKLVQSDGATLTYNVSEDPEAATNTTLEILRKVPGVTVDANDEIKVNGQSSFKIYLNGKEDPMMSGDIKTILKSMPASSIKKIEVISEPGAKYEAEGTGGILNIVTQTRQSLAGYMANLNLYINNRGIGAGAYARTKIGNVTASARFNYNNGKLFHIYNSSSRDVENLNSDQNRLTSTTSRSRNGYDYLGGNISLSWEPDTVNLFTFSANIHANDVMNPSWSTINMHNSAGEKVWELHRYSTSKYNWLGTSAQASYQHVFDKPGHNLVFTYSFNYGMDKGSANMETYDITGDPNWTDSPFSRNVNNEFSNSHRFQADYANPFSSKHLLEAGVKGNFNLDRGDNAPFYGETADNLTIDAGQHVKLNQFRDILAAYGSYTGKFSKWNVRAGLRYEYTRMGIRYKIGNYDDFTTKLNDFVPNASVTYRFDDASNLRMAYQMRISRPGLGVLNPYRNTMNENQVSYGNPDLKSEKSHYVSLAYSNYSGKLSGSFKTSYFFSRNQITDIIFSRDGILNTTYANVGSYNNVSFEGNITWNIVKDLNFQLWLQETYTHISAKSELVDAVKVNWKTNLNASADYRFPCKIRLSAYGGYGSGWVDLQSNGSSWYYYGLGVSRSFLKDDALTINLSTQNFANPTRRSSWTQTSETARYTSTSSFKQWSVGLGISWRFGSLRADVKRTNANMDEDSTSNGGSKGS